MRETIETRRIRLRDMPRIIAIHESIRKKKVSRKWVETAEKRIRKRQTIDLVALKNGEVIGFVFGEVKGEGFGLERTGWIEFLGVDPSHMGIGTGHTMVNRLFDLFRKKGVRDIYTAVQWDSMDMVSFFKSLGFDQSLFINLKRHLG